MTLSRHAIMVLVPVINLSCPVCARTQNGPCTTSPCSSIATDGLPNHGSVTQYLSHQPAVLSSSNLVLSIETLNIYTLQSCHLPPALLNYSLLWVISILFNDFIQIFFNFNELRCKHVCLHAFFAQAHMNAKACRDCCSCARMFHHVNHRTGLD